MSVSATFQVAHIWNFTNANSIHVCVIIFIFVSLSSILWLQKKLLACRIDTNPKSTAKPLLVKAIVSSKKLEEFEHTLKLRKSCHLLEVLLYQFPQRFRLHAVYHSSWQEFVQANLEERYRIITPTGRNSCFKFYCLHSVIDSKTDMNGKWMTVWVTDSHKQTNKRINPTNHSLNWTQR